MAKDLTLQTIEKIKGRINDVHAISYWFFFGGLQSVSTEFFA
jgi:hypothetical protein